MATQDPLEKFEARVAQIAGELAMLRRRKTEAREELAAAFLAVEYHGEASKTGALTKLRSEMAEIDGAMESKAGALAQLEDLLRKATRDSREIQLRKLVAEQVDRRSEAAGIVRQIARLLAEIPDLVRAVDALGEDSHYADLQIVHLERDGDMPDLPGAHLKVARNLGAMLGVTAESHESRLLDLADAAGELEAPDGTSPRSVRLQALTEDLIRGSAASKAAWDAQLRDEERTRHLAEVGVSNIVKNVDLRTAQRTFQAEAKSPTEQVVLGDRIVTVRREPKAKS